MDYLTKPLTRFKIRQISKAIRRLFRLTETELFPVLYILEKICVFFNATECLILEDDKLPIGTFSRYHKNLENGYTIEIKQTVYDGALKGNRAFLSFICHEICHVILFHLGYVPLLPYPLRKNEHIPAYRSVEWQAKALCGELMIPYEATLGMSVRNIMDKYHVTRASAMYRVNLDNKKVKKSHWRRTSNAHL